LSIKPIKFSLLRKKKEITEKTRSERTQSKEEIIVGGKNRLPDQEITVYMLYRAKDANNPIPE